MSSLDLTREWLGTVLRPYSARERVISEVMDILATRKTLAVKTDAFTYDTGQTALLLLLHGTLPINYRGATYQIPLHVWVPHDYPRNPPLAFVVPTKEMGVRKGREVEPGGRVKDEIVQGWWSGWEPKSIEVLLRHLSGIFSATPPVFARPAELAASPARPATQMNGLVRSSGSPGPPNQPPPPPSRPQYLPPHNSFQNGPLPTEYLPQYNPAPTPPPLPYPTQSHHRQLSASYQPSPPPAPPTLPHSVPPVPYRPQVGIPPRQGSLPPSSPVGSSGSGMNGNPPFGVPQRNVSAGYGVVPSQMDRHGSPGPQSGSTGYPSTSQPQRQPSQSYQQNGYPQQGPSAYATNGQETPQPQQIYNGPPHPGPQAQYPGSYPGQQAQYPGPSAYQPHQPGPSMTPKPPQATRPAPIPDLMSSSDSAPLSSPSNSTGPPPLPTSKPPNPSTVHLHSILLPHLTQTLPSLLSSLHASKTHLLERKEDLASGEPAIKDEMARLEAVLKVCEATAGKLGEVVQRGEARVGELESRGEVGVDEVVCGISIAHNQLIDLVAEDNAIDDTIYHITKAFEAERLDLDRFLKSIRSLAREQYMKRALIERILQGMGQTQGW